MLTQQAQALTTVGRIGPATRATPKMKLSQKLRL
jgi:hypothetical protein